MRKYAVNENFFDLWTEPMAYILGFIIADGGISNYNIRIQIHKKDIKFLHYMNEQLSSEYPIRWLNGYPVLVISSKKTHVVSARIWE